jgi:threonine dehydrogenase-like Zn-dependent dehydrogenase
MAAKIAGCATIIACDVVDSRLEMAAELGRDAYGQQQEGPPMSSGRLKKSRGPARTTRSTAPVSAPASVSP